MKTKRLGRTGLMMTENSFGALPVQRVSLEEGAKLLRYAYDQGINFFDTARFYTDSEEKIGLGLSDVRHGLYLATKSMARDRHNVLEQLNTSLLNMKTDYVDILQLHNIPALPDPDDPESAHAALLEAKKAGKCRFIGITTHRRDVALAAAECGLYDTVQFPINYLSTDEDLSLIDVCRKHDVGLIAMKGMSGGLISSPEAAYAFFTQYENVVPIWGVQKQSELDDFLSYAREGVILTDELRNIIENDRRALAGNFCRGCGYCMPTCPAHIAISDAARMILMLRRAPWPEYTTPAFIEKMKNTQNCIDCGACSAHCPYGLDTPALLRENYADYVAFCQEKGISLE
ncbi:MAG: aldo/keto reductase [Clostridiaceae bacterium]|nr:aldo/keto reductase [Clostridiaceae bacterium]